MASNNKKPKSGVLGKLTGLVVFIAAVGSVFFIDWEPELNAPPTPIRPLKTMIIESPYTQSARKYPGKVRANEEVNLAFQVDGLLKEFLVKKGQQVSKDEVLAKLDARDFESRLHAKKGILEKAKSDYEKITKLYEAGNAGKQELVDAKSAYDVATADMKLTQKALDDTVLKAPFAGIIANTFVDNFEDVNQKQQILSLQDVTSVEIVVNIPEKQIVFSDPDGVNDYGLIATFESLPGEVFDVTLKEYSTDADPMTQTYAATLVMPAPEKYNILPGMTATVQATRAKARNDDKPIYAVPITAVLIEGDNKYFIWVVNKGEGNTYTVSKKAVSVGEMEKDSIVVTEGLNIGDRIATAGVHLLNEGQQVRLLSAKGGNTGK